MARDSTVELFMQLSAEISEALERATKQAIREAVVMATVDIEKAVMARLKYPRLQLTVSPEDQSSTLTVTFPERKDG